MKKLHSLLNLKTMSSLLMAFCAYIVVSISTNDASAQGLIQKIPGQRCPTTYNNKGGDMCAPTDSSGGAYVKGEKTCIFGYFESGGYCVKRASSTQKSGSSSTQTASLPTASTNSDGVPVKDRFGNDIYKSFKKKKSGDMCPTTYATAKDYCIASTKFTNVTLPAPAEVRFKEKAACKADELEEYGLYCVGVLPAEWTYTKADAVFTRSFNELYAITMGNDPQALKSLSSDAPPRLAELKAKESGAKKEASSSPSSSASGATTPDQAQTSAASSSASAEANTNANAAKVGETVEAAKAIGGFFKSLKKKVE